METSPRQPLAIVGASARAAAYSALRAGFQPVTADLFADLDLRRIATATRISPYPAGLIDWLRTIQPPAWMYTGALENDPDLIDQMAWIAPLWGNAGDVLSQVRSPWILADTLRDRGFRFPETKWSPEGLPCDGSWLVKTYRGASGSGVRVFDVTTDVVGSSASESRPPRSGVQVPCFQKRINGVPCAGAYVGSGQGAGLIGLTRQIIGESWLHANEFQYAGSIGPYWPEEAALAEIWRIGGELAEHFSLVGLFGVDFIINHDEVWTLEVNPRYTASFEIIERAMGASLFGAHAMACGMTLWDLITAQKERCASQETAHPPQPPDPQRVYGKAILFAKRPVSISENFVEWALEKSNITPWPELADISPAGTHIDTGRPVITVFATGASDADVEQNLRDRVAELESRLYAAS